MKKALLICIAVMLGFIVLIFCVGKTTIKMNTKNTVEFTKSKFYNEYYNTDDFLLINAWATWCKPCIEEFPILEKIESEFKGTNLKMVSISLDEDTIRLKKFLNKRVEIRNRDITMNNLIFREAIYQKIKLVDSENKNSLLKFSSKQIPYVVLIKNKKILYRTYGDIDVDLLKRIISKKPSH